MLGLLVALALGWDRRDYLRSRMVDLVALGLDDFRAVTGVEKWEQ